MKIPNKIEIQRIAINHSSDIEFKDFTNVYKNYTAEQYSFKALCLKHLKVEYF